MKGIIFTLLSVNLFCSATFAQGTLGGGVSIIVDGVPHLRDVYDHCEWDYLKSIQNAESLKVFDALQKTHWLFAESLKSEFANLKVCVTPNGLVPIKVDANPSFRIYRAPPKAKGRAHQVAIRILDSNLIFLDQLEYDLLGESNKTALLVHEAVHSFIPNIESNSDLSKHENIFSRNDQVRSISNLIVKNANQLIPQRKFALNLKMNWVDVLEEIPVDLDRTHKEVIILAHSTQDATIVRQEIFEAIRKIDLEKYEPSEYLRGALLNDFRLAVYKATEPAIKAIQDDKLEVLKTELAEGVPVDSRIGQSLVKFAIKHKKTDALVLLLNEELSSRETYGEAILFLLKANQHLDKIPDLLKKAGQVGFEVANCIIHSGQNLLIQVLFTDKRIESSAVLEVINEILKDQTLSSLWFESALQNTENYLQVARMVVEARKEAAWKAVLKKSFDLNEVDPVSGSPLFYSVVKKVINRELNEAFFGELIKYPGLNVSAQTLFKQDALSLGMNYKRFDIATQIAAHPTFQSAAFEPFFKNIAYSDCEALMMQFVQNRHVKLVQALLRYHTFDKLYLLNLLDQASMVAPSAELVQLLRDEIERKDRLE